MEIAIKVENLNKWYGNNHVIKNLNLEIKKGEIFGLLGPNGAGKTTLIKILTGQTHARGFANVMGINPIRNPVKVRRVIGIVPETESVPNYLTVKEYLYFVVKVRNLEVERVNEAMKVFHLHDYSDIVCKDLSKGTKQRVMFAAAMIHNPQILFLDEPFINLDPIYQREIESLLKSYIGRGGTIFMATHILDMARRVCTRIGIMRDGRIAKVTNEVGNIEEIFLKVMENAEVLHN